ncbi:hypothetical protein NLX83_06680 [Allokutzneria sp. A3M-2-11 16]|uniref:hypothetical protein n=1 Tax=Allokutzneria sp. A3M-2-11 16 TaxID=2962043 RepID=UPI0020B89B7F|nr:hypothetical protein [Allokutzneria sp. A3M-2-11 16]MCP3798936.1 hypothetical protein [Allokutzneria sp. A3M-2-11 16]
MSSHGPKPSAPTAMRVSFVLVAASVVATVAGLVLTFAHRDELVRIVQDATADMVGGILSQSAVGDIAGASIDDSLRSSAVFQGICCAALMLLGVLATRGKNWARVLLTVVAVFTVLAAFLSGDARYPSVIVFAVMAAQVLQVGTVISLWLPASNEFFQRSKAADTAPLTEAYALRLR